MPFFLSFNNTINLFKINIIQSFFQQALYLFYYIAFVLLISFWLSIDLISTLIISIIFFIPLLSTNTAPLYAILSLHRVALYFCILSLLTIILLWLNFENNISTELLYKSVIINVLIRSCLVLLVLKIFTISYAKSTIFINIISIVLFVTLIDLISKFSASTIAILIPFFIYVCTWYLIFTSYEKHKLFELIKFAFLSLILLMWYAFDVVFNPDKVFFCYLLIIWINSLIITLLDKTEVSKIRRIAFLCFNISMILFLVLNLFLEISYNTNVFNIICFFVVSEMVLNDNSLLPMWNVVGESGLNCFTVGARLPHDHQRSWMFSGKPGQGWGPKRWFGTHSSCPERVLFWHKLCALPLVCVNNILLNGCISGIWIAPDIKNNSYVKGHPTCPFELENDILLAQATTSLWVSEKSVPKNVFQNLGINRDLNGKIATLPLTNKLMLPSKKLSLTAPLRPLSLPSHQYLFPAFTYIDNPEVAKLYKNAYSKSFSQPRQAWTDAYLDENKEKIRNQSFKIASLSTCDVDNEPIVLVWKVEAEIV